VDTLRKNNPAVGKVVDTTFSLRPSESFTRFTHPFVNASIAYTPYMYAKAEFAKLWDNGKTDVAVERMIDGATKFNWGEFKAGLSEIGSAILHKPFADPAREAVAQRRLVTDTSQSDAVNLTDEEKQQETVAASAAPSMPNWRERVVAGTKEDAPEVGANKPKTYAEREEMRKVLEQAQPPTNSVH
jgi:hypothetical protein